MAGSDRYATFANFGGGHRDESTRPLIKGVVLAESIKRRLPSKHYVSLRALSCPASYAQSLRINETQHIHEQKSSNCV